MDKGWQEDHDKAWEKENKRVEQEKYEEKYWCEIEMGDMPPKPTGRRGIVQKGGDIKWLPETAPLEQRLKQIEEELRKK